MPAYCEKRIIYFIQWTDKLIKKELKKNKEKQRKSYSRAINFMIGLQLILTPVWFPHIDWEALG